MKIVILDGYGLNPGDLSWSGLEALGTCSIYDRTPSQEVVNRAQNAEVLITNKTVITADILTQLPTLKYIGVMATGYNVVDLAAATAQGITVTNVPAYSTPSVAQMVFAHLLHITQQVAHYATKVSEGRWTHSPDFCFWDSPLIELSGLKIGIIGMGQTGQATARVASGFGMQICTCSSKSVQELPKGVTALKMDTLFAECDVVSLHCALTTETKYLVNAHRLVLMKPSAILINTGRGDLVNEQDLADALNSGMIRAAGVDVLSTEPPLSNNPLLTAKNCFITPHIAWATYAARQRMMHILLDNVRGYIGGNIINKVN